MNALMIIPLVPDSYMLVTVEVPETVMTQKVMTVVEGRGYQLDSAIRNWFKAYIDANTPPKTP